MRHTLKMNGKVSIAMRTFNPDEEILDYCKHIIHAHIQTVRNDRKNKTWYWDYPAMAAICHNSSCNAKRGSYSHYPQKKEFHQVLERKLMELGEIGGHSRKTGKRYIIGNCAEQHAANNYMKQCEEDDLNNLYFSKAMRPRTKQVFEYCDNCKDTFPNL